jgi:molybdenum cofactor guanylyltransferase
VLTGAVLAGGRSRRFGKNKALEIFKGKRLLDHAVESLHSFCDPVLVIANDLSIYYDVPATLIQDMILHQGPLAAIYTALLYSPHEWVFVKATDMPYLEPELPTLMFELRTGVDVVTPTVNKMYEPLLALYNRRCLPAIAATLEGTERQVVAFYKKVKVKAVEEIQWRAVDKEGRSFWNINTAEDWEKLLWS